MFLNSFSRSNIHQKGKQSSLPFTNIYTKTGLLTNNSLSKQLNKTSKIKMINYIHYTFSEKTNKFIHRVKSSKKYQTKSFNTTMSNKQKLNIVNDYLKSFQKSFNWKNSLIFPKEKENKKKNSRNILYNTNKELNYNNYYNNNYYKEENLNKNNLSKISNNISFKSFLNDNNGSTQSKIEPYDFIQFNPKSYRNNTNNINSFSKLKIHSAINSSMPILKRIKILKEAKSSISKMQKNKSNNSSSFKTFFEESNISKNNNDYSKNKKIFENDFYKEYYNNSIEKKKPIIIKYLPKPKLSVPKYININNINLV